MFKSFNSISGFWFNCLAPLFKYTKALLQISLSFLKFGVPSPHRFSPPPLQYKQINQKQDVRKRK